MKTAPSCFDSSSNLDSTQFEIGVRDSLKKFKNLEDIAENKNERTKKYYEISQNQGEEPIKKNDIEWQEQLKFDLEKNTFFNVIVQKMKFDKEDTSNKDDISASNKTDSLKKNDTSKIEDKYKGYVLLHFLDWKDEYHIEVVETTTKEEKNKLKVLFYYI